MNTVNILIADDHEIIRQGIKALLEKQTNWVVCGEAENGREAVRLAERLKPDVAILDISMPNLNGLEATRMIKHALPATEVLIFTMHESEQLVHGVLAAGAHGYLLKSGACRYLVPAIETLLEHKPFFSSKVSQLVFESYLHGGAPGDGASRQLTPRELEITQLLAEGKSNKDVAQALGISVKTAETHRAAIMRKLDLGSFSELVRYAIRNQIIEL